MDWFKRKGGAWTSMVFPICRGKECGHDRPAKRIGKQSLGMSPRRLGRRHPPDACRHAWTAMSIPQPEADGPFDVGPHNTEASLQDPWLPESNPVSMPEDMGQVAASELDHEARKEEMEGQIEHQRPQAAFAFSLVAVHCPRMAGRTTAKTRSLADGGERAGNRIERGIQFNGH